MSESANPTNPQAQSETGGTTLGSLIQEAQGGGPAPAAETTPAAPAPAPAAEPQPAPQPKPITRSQKSGGFYWGTGRRKTAVARVRVRPGSGKFMVNDREVEKYFTEERDRKACYAALQATGTSGQLDVFVRLNGGGFAGQAGAVLLGVARALKAADPTLEKILRDHGYLTRDSRMKERKKYGQRGARRRFQFSKR